MKLAVHHAASWHHHLAVSVNTNGIRPVTLGANVKERAPQIPVRVMRVATLGIGRHVRDFLYLAVWVCEGAR